MADINQILQALKQADAVGNTEDAQKLAEYARALQSQSQPTGPDYSLGELASTSLKRGFKQTSSLVGDVLPALGLSALGFDEAAERQMMEARATQEAIQRDLPAQFPSFRDVQWTNPADVGKFVIEAMGENATNLIPVLGLGIGGAKVGANIASKKAFENLVDRRVSDKVKNRITDAASRKGADLGQVGGVFLGSYALNAPETFRGIYEETGSFEPGAALLAGAVNASLDSIFPVTLLRTFRPSVRAGIVGKVLEKSGMNPSLANNAVTRVFGAAGLEGITEGSQEAVNITAENFVKDNGFVFESKDYERVLEGAVKGAAAGGGYRAVGETVRGLTTQETPPPPSPTTTTDEDAKVKEAQRLNELAAAERVSREAEVERLQQEFDEKITTEEGINDVLNNMDKYFGNKTQEEINVIRNDLKKVKNNLKVQGEPIGKEKVKTEIEPQEKFKKLTKADKAKLKSLAKKTLAAVLSYGSINSDNFRETFASIKKDRGIEAAEIFRKEGERLSKEKLQFGYNKDGQFEPIEDAEYEAAEIERRKREAEFDKESAQLKVNQRLIRNLKNRKDYTEEKKQEIIKLLEEENKELKAAIKARPKALTKEDALKKDILSFAEKEGKLSNNAVSKELKVNARKTGVLLDELVKSGDLNLNVVKGRKVYTVPDYVEPEAKPKEKKTYGGIPAAKPGVVGYKQGSRDNSQRVVETSNTLKRIIELSGIPFVSQVARREFKDFMNITPDTLDANLQKTIIDELNAFMEDNLIGEESIYGKPITRKEARLTLTERVTNMDNIDELVDVGIDTQTIEALKEYSQEVNDDINTRESRERDRGATTVAEQERLGARDDASIQTTEETATKVVDETDGDAVAATGPDTRQFTGGERGVYPALKTSNVEQSKTEFKPSEDPQLTNGRDKKDLAPSEKGDFELSGGQQEGTITNPVGKQRKFDKINYAKGMQFTVLPQTLENTYGKKTLSNIRIVEEGTNWAGAHHNGGIALQGLWPYVVPIGPNVVAHELGHAAHSLLGKKINNNMQVFNDLKNIEEFLYPDLRTTVENAINEGKELSNNDIEFFNYLLSPEELIAEFNVLRMADPSTAKAVAPFIVEQFESVDKAPNLVKVRKTFPTGFGSIVAKASKAFDNNYTKLHADMGIAAGVSLEEIRLGTKDDREKFTGEERGFYPELEDYAVEVTRPNGDSIRGIYQVQDAIKVFETDSMGRVLREKRKPQNIKPRGVIKYQQINKDIQLEEGENLNYLSGDYRDFRDNLQNKYGENVLIRKKEYVTSRDIVTRLYDFETEIETPMSIAPSTTKDGNKVITRLSTEDVKKFEREMSRRAKLKRKPKDKLIIELDDSTRAETGRRNFFTLREGDPRDAKIINKLKSKRTLGQVLTILDKENITPSQKELVTVLLSLPNIKDVKFNIVRDSDLPSDVFGEYDVENNFIKVGVSGDVQAVLHEATHAATANQLTKHISRDNRGKTTTGKSLVRLYENAVAAAEGRYENELENIDEFVASAFNNPEFQQFLAQVESPTSDEAFLAGVRDDLRAKGATTREIRNTIESYRERPLEETIESVWRGFVRAVRQIINPNNKLDLRSSVLNDVIALAPELFVGPNPIEQAQGPQGKLFIKKGDESKTISEENVKSLNIKVDPAEYKTFTETVDEVRESDISDEEVNKALSNNDAFIDQAAGKHIVTRQDEILREKNDIDMHNDTIYTSGSASPLTMSEVSRPTKLFNMISDHISSLPFAQRGIGETVANAFSRIPESLGRLYAGFLSPGQVEELYGARLPTIGTLKRNLEAKASLNKKGYEEITYVVQYVESVLNKYRETEGGQALLKEYNRIILKLSGFDTDPEVMLNEPNAEHVPSRTVLTNETTLQGLVGKDVAEAMLSEKKTKKQKETLKKFTEDVVDGLVTIPAPYVMDANKIYETRTNQQFLDSNPEVATLVGEYDALPQDLKDITIRMVEDLRVKYTRLLEATIRDNPENEASIRKQFRMRPYYMPFIRRGNYWYKYIDTETGEVGYGSAASPAARDLKMREVEEQGIGTDVSISTREAVATAGLGPNRNIEAFAQTVKDSIKDIDFSGVPEDARKKIKEKFVNTVSESYLQLFPDQSLKQQQQERKAVPGYIEDVLLSYSEVAPKITSSLANVTYNKQLISNVNAIQKEANKPENRDNNIIKGVAGSTISGMEFFLNPIANLWAASAAYVSYYWFLGLNPSSAIINLTQLPLVVFPYLEAEYKFGNTSKALQRASNLYFAGGREQTKFQDGSVMGQVLNDLTMAPFKVDFKTGTKTYIGKNAKLFAPKGGRIEVTRKDGKTTIETAKEDGLYYKVYNAAEESQTIRRGISYEATELSRESGAQLEKPNRIKNKIDASVGWMFQNSERANREITLIAAYDLEMEALLGKDWKDISRTSKSWQDANQRATTKSIEMTVRAHSHALPEAGPEFFRTGLPKVMTIFKRFAQQQIYLISKMFLLLYPPSYDIAGMTKQQKEDYDKERKVAARRIIGIYAFSILLAGIQGAPFYGLVKGLVELILDDEDEPFDLDTYVMQTFGNDLYGGPINRALNIDMSRRTGFRDMVFRTDEARLEKLGFFLYGLETLSGPTGSIIGQTTEGLKETFADGFNPSIRSTEKMLPTAISNALKSYRQATEGVVNKRGLSITDDPSLYQSVMQAFGFTSWEVAQAYRKANALKGPERRLYQRRSKLLLKYWLALRVDDRDALNDIKEEISEYNDRAPRSFRITNETISRSVSNRRKLERRAVNGVDIKNLQELQDIYGIIDN